MPAIVERHPEAVYYILGQTHPVTRQQEGEHYRETLANHAAQLGVAEHVRFVDRYLTKAEVMQYLAATDVYVTPYLNLEQVTSGTLAYAVGSGCPVVSTPYLHAQYLIGEDGGILVPPRDPMQLAHGVLQLLDDPQRQNRMAARNWALGQTLLWPKVGADYLRVFQAISHRAC